MATNHTEHCQLSQWEPGDQVLRTDFNADHAKLDAALEGRVRKDILLDLTLGADQQTVTLDVTNINWEDYWMVLLTIIPSVSQNSILRITTRGYSGTPTHRHFDGDSEYDGLGEVSLDEPCMMWLLTMRSSNNFVTALSLGYGYFNYGTHPGARFQNIQSIELWSRDSRFPFRSGSIIRLVGIQ